MLARSLTTPNVYPNAQPHINSQKFQNRVKSTNINKIFVMNADAYISFGIWAPLPTIYDGVSFEISVWICHVKYTDTYAF